MVLHLISRCTCYCLQLVWRCHTDGSLNRFFQIQDGFFGGKLHSRFFSIVVFVLFRAPGLALTIGSEVSHGTIFVSSTIYPN